MNKKEIEAPTLAAAKTSRLKRLQVQAIMEEYKIDFEKFE